MDIEDSHWDAYEARFRKLAEDIPLHKGPLPELASAHIFLCLYGDNGLSPEKELDILSQLEQQHERVKGVEMLTAYWEDIVLYIPADAS